MFEAFLISPPVVEETFPTNEVMHLKCISSASQVHFEAFTWGMKKLKGSGLGFEYNVRYACENV